MGRSVVTRLETVAFEPGRNSKAWTARSANTLESNYSGLQNNSLVDADFSIPGPAKRTDESSTGEWCLAVKFSPRARRAEHTAKTRGLKLDHARLSPDQSPKTSMRHFRHISKTSGWIGFALYLRPEKYTSSGVTLNIKLPTWSLNPTVRTSTSTTWSYSR